MKSEASLSNEWATRWTTFRPWQLRYGLNWDVCAASWNAKLPGFWTRRDNALKQDWTRHPQTRKGFRGWMNPPYGGGWPERFMARARMMVVIGADLVCALVPAYSADGWYQRHVLGQRIPGGIRPADASRFVRGEAGPAENGWPAWTRWVFERLVVEVHQLAGRERFVERRGQTGTARFSSVVVVFYRPELLAELAVELRPGSVDRRLACASTYRPARTPHTRAGAVNS